MRFCFHPDADAEFYKPSDPLSIRPIMLDTSGLAQ